MAFKEKLKKFPGLLSLHRQVYLPAKRSLYRAWGKAFIKGKKGFEPMIISYMDGGLGSQMWQWALGYVASRESGLPVKYDIKWFEKSGKDLDGICNRNFDLTRVFPKIPFKEAADQEIKLYRKYFLWLQKYICLYNEKILKSREPRYLGGYMLGHTYIHTYIHTCLKGIL